MNFQGFFITGTDTNVGKTLVAAALILKLQSLGIKTIGFKPVVAGMRQVDGKMVNEDIETLLMVSRDISPNLQASDICPYFLEDPAAPHLVAEKVGITLDIRKMRHHYNSLKENIDAIVVEGAGGFLVPLNEDITLGDFAQEINLPVILVVDIKLGCINHALLSAEAIHHRGLELYGWVANSMHENQDYARENINTLKNILKKKYNAHFIGDIPYIQNKSAHEIYILGYLRIAIDHLSLDI